MSDQIPGQFNPEGGEQPPLGQPVPPTPPPGAPTPPPPPSDPAGAQQQYQQQYQQQPPTYGQAGASSASQLENNLVLNYWLSVFFSLIPALIFYFIDKDKNARLDQFNKENLNFTILRTIAVFVSIFIIWIPIVGLLAFWVAHLGGLILHLLVAVKVKENYEKGAAPGFLFNLPLVK